MQLVLFNAPPLSGKDTIAQAIVDADGGRIMKFADPMYEWICNLLGIDRAEAERTKDLPHPALGGKTIRNMLIAYSELFMKPTLGHDVWGNILVERLKPIYALPDPMRPKRIYITDLGFREELVPLVQHFGIRHMFMVQLHRSGTTFENDSRDWVDHAFESLTGRAEIFRIAAENNGTVAECVDEILASLVLNTRL